MGNIQLVEKCACISLPIVLYIFINQAPLQQKVKRSIAVGYAAWVTESVLCQLFRIGIFLTENKRPCVGFLTVPVVLELPFYVTMRTNVQPYD